MAAYCNAAMSYSNTGGCYDGGKHGHGHNGGRAMPYSTIADGGGGRYKREEKQRGSRERVGETSAFFSLHAACEAKKHQLEAGYGDGDGGAPKKILPPSMCIRRLRRSSTV